MDCQETQRLMDAFVDHEIDPAQGEHVEAHLGECPNCSQMRRELMALRLAARDLRVSAPPEFVARVRAQVRDDARRRHAFSLRIWKLTSLAACIVAAVSIAFAALHYRHAEQPAMLADAIVSSHVRSLMADHLLDVVSSDQHTVKPWFTGRIDFSPDVRDFATDGFVLLGGRLDYLGQQPAVALVYRHDKHVINAFTWPARDATPLHEGSETRGGFHIVRFRAGDMNWFLISDASDQTLQSLARLIRR